MENSKGSSNVRNFTYTAKQSLLPPKCPFPSISALYPDYISREFMGTKVVSRGRDVNSYHQRTSSESNLIEEQPSWLDDLLNEPETPVRKSGHRRSSSDSFAYIDAAYNSNIDYAIHDEYKLKTPISVPSWGSRDFDHHRNVQHAHLYNDLNTFRNQKNRPWERTFDSPPYTSGKNSVIQSIGLSCPRNEGYSANEKHDQLGSGMVESKLSSERKDCSFAKPSVSEADTNRAKQQFAQRSRVRKLQYIAELERNVQALQAEGSEVSSELEFLNQQSLILSMENKALKQRLDSLAQEQLIKHLEHEVLEREFGRLRALYQQQPQQTASSNHRSSNSEDLLDSQFANLSLKPKESNVTIYESNA